MRNLKSACSWDDLYSPHTHSLVKDFYEPVLKNTVKYDRIAGYFKSNVLSSVSAGYEAFCNHPEAKMRLIVGLELYQDDHDRILYWDDKELLEERMLEEVEKELSREDMPDFEKSRLAGLSWMLANNKLEVKFGVMLDQETKEPMPWEWGKYHHKICRFTDEVKPEANAAMIIGSTNESSAGWGRNGDSFAPQVSWEPGRTARQVEASKKLFEEHWNLDGFDEKQNVGVFRLSKLEDSWKRIVPPINPKDTQKSPDGDQAQPDEDEDEWAHKIKARELFMAPRDPKLTSAPMPAGQQGILCMATGTGKTRTALKIVKQMIEEDQIEKVIITTHKSDLLDQWWKEMAKPKIGLTELLPARFRHYSIAGKRSYKEMDKFTHGMSRYKSLLIGRNGLQKLLQTSDDKELERTLLIVDECHNFRGEEHRKAMAGLYSKVPYRLGLSATPENEYNEEATNFLFDEIGPIFFNYQLLDAIRDEILCPFEYTPINYHPTDAEKAKAHRIYQKIEAKRKENPQANCTEEYRNISDIYKNSVGKLPELEKLLENTSILDRCIIFGPKKEYNSSTMSMLTKAKVRWTPYYGETNQHKLDLYRREDVEVLLTCKAVSEGIDLHVNNIVLLSSDATRLVTLQRLGRALRTHGDLTKVAKVFDFVRVSDRETADSKRREWLAELSEAGLASRSD